MSLSIDEFESPAPIKPLLNIGARMDIPAGYYETGLYGESILNGGLAYITGILSMGNNFKSTLMHYMSHSALSKFLWIAPTHLLTYDADGNKHEPRLIDLTQRFEPFIGRDIIAEGIWRVNDKRSYLGSEWYAKLKRYLDSKVKDMRHNSYIAPFPDRTGKDPMWVMIPTFSEIDPLTEFTDSSVEKIQDENDIGESGGNIINMRSGLGKDRLLQDLPGVCMRGAHYMTLSAAEKYDQPTQLGPFSTPPAKKLPDLKGGKRAKGVSDRFYSLVQNLWVASSNTVLQEDKTKMPKFPRTPDEQVAGDSDLRLVNLMQSRGKAGATGLSLAIVLSQQEGVLAELTEYNALREARDFGLTPGKNYSYTLDLYPGARVTRPTARQVIDRDPLFRRALNITSELEQLTTLQKHKYRDLLCTPKELYEDLKGRGYEIEQLLNTRGWWTLNNDKHPVPFLSTLDLLKMRKGLYKPYWLP